MQILIVGAGDVGFQLAKRLAREQHDITLIDADGAKVRRAHEQIDAQVIEGSGSSLQVLRQAGIEQADVLAAVSNDDGVNLMACRLAKARGRRRYDRQAGQPRVFAARFPAHG